MNNEEIKILSYLSDNLGSGGSILDITKKLKGRHNSIYYSNIYNTIKRLNKKGFLKIEKEGKSSLINIDFDNPGSIYCLSEIENHKSAESKIPKDITTAILDQGIRMGPITICALEADKHLKINRIELLLIIDGRERRKLIGQLQDIESRNNTKIDPIILSITEFEQIMKTEEQSSLKDMIVDRTILYNSESFWRIIMKYSISGKYKKLGKQLQDLTENELAFNYSRFGYSLYEKTKDSGRISLEETIFLMSTKTEARTKYGAIILLYKNLDRIKWGYLYYFYKRYDLLDELKGMLTSINEIKGSDDKNIKFYINIIKNKPTHYDKGIIARYLQTYG